MRTEWIFRGAVFLSVLAHGILLVHGFSDDGSGEERIVEIPVMLEAPPPPPLPPPPPKEEEPPKKERPKKLAKRIKKVVKTEGLTTGEMVDAEEGEYKEEASPEPEPAPEPVPEPVPKPKPKPKVDKVKLAREFLSELRSELMSKKTYPLAAQRMGITGAVLVSFVVGADSSFSKIAIKRSSGHDVLDKAAISTVVTLSGRLKRPAQLGDTDLKTSVILRYELDG